MAVACYLDETLIYTLVDPEQVRQFEHMYNPSSLHHFNTENRQSDSNLYMFGFYIYNNISIGFQCFASGLLCAAGSIFFWCLMAYISVLLLVIYRS